MLSDPEIADLIEETYNAIDQAVQTSIRTETPPELTSALENNAFVFSGFKTYHQLSEVGLSLTRRDGSVKPFNEFRKDVEAINSRYNGSYLYAEYNHAIHASQMAVKWNDFVKDGDEYYLQYRTAGDDRVREAHARLDGTTLPPSDPFWNEFLPPNGWNCRCQTVQVLRDDYAVSDSQRAIENGRQCTSEPKQQMFRFNPGKEMKIFPPKHPYLPRGCGDCGKRINFAYDPKREQCIVCRNVCEQARIHLISKLYDRLSKDPKYTNVEFNKQTGALKATHRGHIMPSNSDEKLQCGLSGHECEVELQDLLFKNGHTVILCDEMKLNKSGERYSALDMQLDGVMMDIKTVQNKNNHYGSHISKKNKQLHRYNARPDVSIPADTVCLYFREPELYHKSKISQGYKWAKEKQTNLVIKHVVSIVRNHDGTISIYRYDHDK